MTNAKQIGLFYASTTGNTEDVAQLIAERLESLVQLHDIAVEGVAAMQQYSLMIMGIPTWDYGELQEDWQECWQAIAEQDFVGKRVALFGLGDQMGYGEWFQDAMGELHQLLTSIGATLVVPWPVDGYSFEASRALTDDEQYFVGLALDEDGQHGVTEERLDLWLPQVCQAFDLQQGG
ncbi:flavodoxin [Nitrincola sp. MINF-07-Sa-05]|uniref:flavodoxin n=1 Tax=Nitrincola salilacus TaxID=3400273 RepID=UPI003917BBD6